MPHFQFPCHYVYWENVKDHCVLKRKYMPIMDEIERTNTCKNPFPYSSINNITIDEKCNNFIDSKDLEKIVWTPIDNFINEINSKYNFKINVTDSFIEAYWFNTYTTNDYQEYHSHNEHRKNSYYPIFSGIYIINDDNEKSSVVFKLPDSVIFPFTELGMGFHFDTGDISDIKEGSVMIFSSQLEHMVKKCIKPGRRTIAFNVFSKL
jgi:hypothetical protein